MRTFARMLVVAALIAGSRGGAGARSIDVFPGPGTPFQDAVDAAAPRDTLRVHDGAYAEAVVVNKPLKIRAAEYAWGIEAGCGVATAFDVAADHVSVRSGGISGGTAQSVRVHGTRVALSSVNVQSVCSSGDGMRVESSSAVTIRVNGGFGGVIAGWDAGLRLVSLPLEARVKVIGSGFGGAAIYANAPTGVGVVIENSAAGSALGRSGIQLVSKVAIGHASPDSFGIPNLRLVGSDGIVSRHVFYGFVELDAQSDNNLFFGGSMSAAVNDGTGNCVQGSFYYGPPASLPACP